MSHNNKRLPAVAPGHRNDQPPGSKYEREKLDAFPLARIARIERHALLCCSELGGRCRIQHLQRVATANRSRHDTSHLTSRNWRRGACPGRLAATDWYGKTLRESRGGHPCNYADQDQIKFDSFSLK